MTTRYSTAASYQWRLAAVSLGLFSALSACSSNSSQQDPVAAARFENERKIKEADITSHQLRDADFMVTAAAGTQLLTEASRLAEQKSTQPTVRTQAAQVLRDYSQVNQNLRQLAQQKALILPSALGADQQKAYQELAAAAGPTFDKQYAQLQLTTHQQLAEAFDDLREDAYDGDIRGFAAKYNPLVADHLKQAETLVEQNP